MRMELGLSQHQTIKQIQTLSPQMYMSMEILCLNSLDLEERIDTELENNETLELVEKPREAEAASADAEAVAAPEAPVAPTEDSFDRKVEGWEEYSREEYASSRSVSSYAGEKDEKLEALSNTEGRPESLQEHLEEQVHLLDKEEVLRITGPLTDEEMAALPHLCVDIIYNIDNRGYLMYGLEEIQASLESKPSLALLQNALAVIQATFITFARPTAELPLPLPSN